MSSEFIVSARKYRPTSFDSVVGQSSVTNTLKNAIRQNRPAQAYLFCGPRGVGKTTCARILAKTLNCTNRTSDIEACDQCESCISFQKQRSLNIIELDAASNNSVDDIRKLIDQVRIPPQIGKYSIYIIDEVHMLSAAAFNAFLKTLEEPPAHAIFILATTEKHKILPTILSRCQIFDFRRINIEDTINYLATISEKENVTYDRSGLRIIAQKADGGMRDALSIYDQIVSYSSGEVSLKKVMESLNMPDYENYFKLVDDFLTHNTASPLMAFDEILTFGFDAHDFLMGMASHFRDLLVCKDTSTLQLLEVGDEVKQRYKEQAALCSQGFLIEALSIVNEIDIQYKASKNQRLLMELCLLKLANIGLEKKKSDALTSESAATPTAPIQTKAATPIKPQEISIRNTAQEIAERKNAPSQKVEEYLASFGGEILDLNEPNLRTVWEHYTNSIQDNSRLVSILSAANNKLSLASENQILFAVNDASQQSALTPYRQEVLAVLRGRFGIENLMLKVEVLPREIHKTIAPANPQQSPQTQAAPKPVITPTAPTSRKELIYQKLVQENPAIELLRNSFSASLE